MPDLRNATGRDIRLAAREGALTSPTPGLAMGFVQANLVIVPKDLAFDFLLFCQRNPKPCPLLDVTESGDPEPKGIAPGSDVRTDLPKYRVWKYGGLVDEPTDIRKYWRDDLVAILIGCSFTFENGLLAAGVPIRHIELTRDVPTYRSYMQGRPAAPFPGPTAVSTPPMTPAQTVTATTICSRFGRAHGPPLHLGDPSTLGIKNLDKPDFGEVVPIHAGEVPVF